jgi:S-DNA-T family DNA segregation ATPase FtsK/SpoIIIE
MGADKLLGNGDMLFLSPGTSTLLRGQGTFMSDDEITNVVDSVATNSPQFVHELVQLKPAGETDASTSDIKNRDELYESAIDVVIREERGSVSLLQRTLGIGYGRAARLIDFMAEDGIVGPYNGSQAREVLIDAAGWAEMNSEQPSATTEGTCPNRIRLAATTEEEVEYAEYATDEVEKSPTDGASDEWEADADDVEYEEDALADGEEEEYEEEEYEEDTLEDGEEEEYEEEYEEEDAYEEETV